MAAPQEGGAEQLLRQYRLRLTQNRKLVLEVFLAHDGALSQRDIEERLGPMDRITLYRTLRSFEEGGLVHRAVDGTDKVRFALCRQECRPADHRHDHAHFHCTRCQKTVCLDGISMPKIRYPLGYQVEESHLVMQGCCPTCVMVC